MKSSRNYIKVTRKRKKQNQIEREKKINGENIFKTMQARNILHNKHEMDKVFSCTKSLSMYSGSKITTILNINEFCAQKKNNFCGSLCIRNSHLSCFDKNSKDYFQ